jgi:hypothetical protein
MHNSSILGSEMIHTSMFIFSLCILFINFVMLLDMATAYASTRETTNYAIFGDILRNILDRNITPRDLPGIISRSKDILFHFLNPSQRELLYPTQQRDKQVSTAELDISTMYVLLRHLCPQLAPSNGWGNPPHSVQGGILGDVIEHISFWRYTELAHSPCAHISWAQMQAIAVSADQHLGTTFGNRVDQIADECMEPEMEQLYEEKHYQMYLSDQKTQGMKD